MKPIIVIIAALCLSVIALDIIGDAGNWFIEEPFQWFAWEKAEGTLLNFSGYMSRVDYIFQIFFIAAAIFMHFAMFMLCYLGVESLTDKT